MSQQKICSLPKDELALVLEQLEATYEKQLALCNPLRKACLALEPDKEAVALSVKTSLEEVQSSINTLENAQKTRELEKKPISNDLLLLKIKLMIVKARIDTICSDLLSEHVEPALNTFTQIKLELIKHAKLLNVKDNPIQKELAHALRLIAIYGKEGLLKGQFDAAQWQGVEWCLIRQFKDDIDKLESYRGNIDFSNKKASLFLAEKRDFYSVYDTIVKDYELRLKQNKLGVEDKVNYLKATYLVYHETINYHPIIQKTNLDIYLTKKNHPINPMAEFIRVLDYEFERFGSKIQSLRKSISVDALMEDIESIRVLQYIMPLIFELFQNQLKDILFIHNHLSLTNETVLKDKVFALIIKMRQLLIQVDEANCWLDLRIKDELSFYFLNRNPLSKYSEPFVEEQYLDEVELEQFQIQYLTLKAQSNGVTNINTNSVSKEKKNTKKRPKNKSNQPQKNNNNTTVSKTPESQKPAKEKIKQKVETPLSESQKHLEEANLQIRNKQFEKAIQSYEMANSEALTLEDKLNATEGLIFSIQQVVLKSLNQINPEYDFVANKLEATDEILTTAEKNTLYLDNLYKRIGRLTQSLDNTSLKEKKSDILLGNEILRKDYCHIEELKKQLYCLKEKALAPKIKPQVPKVKTSAVTPKSLMPTNFPSLLDTVNPQPCYIQKEKQVTLFFELVQVFNFLKSIPGEHYLVGSMVLHLLLDEKDKHYIQPLDLDFLTLHSKSEDWIKNGYFMQITEEKHLYKLMTRFEFKPILPLEVWLDEEKKDLKECLLARDFTVSALACTSLGKIIDPTGLGFDDLKQRRLRMIGNPTQRFEKSPSILLRVIKYSLLGFTPDKAILDAMHAWLPSKFTNKEKLQTLCEKLFLNSDKQRFVEQLLKYQLASKIYDLPTEITREEVLLYLEKKQLEKALLKSKSCFFQRNPLDGAEETPTQGLNQAL